MAREMRGTGGNRFISRDSGIRDVVEAVRVGLYELQAYAEATDRILDLGEITVHTSVTNSGDRISVSVTGDLGVKE